MEPQVKFNDQLLTDPESDLGSLVPNRPSLAIDDYNKTFTDSQQRAFEWISVSLTNHKQTNTAIVGPAGTRKSYLLNVLIELMRSRGLVVAKLGPPHQLRWYLTLSVLTISVTLLPYMQTQSYTTTNYNIQNLQTQTTRCTENTKTQ